MYMGTSDMSDVYLIITSCIILHMNEINYFLVNLKSQVLIYHNGM